MGARLAKHPHAPHDDFNLRAKRMHQPKCALLLRTTRFSQNHSSTNHLPPSALPLLLKRSTTLLQQEVRAVLVAVVRKGGASDLGLGFPCPGETAGQAACTRPACGQAFASFSMRNASKCVFSAFVSLKKEEGSLPRAMHARQIGVLF